ncbi:hypothetical protein BD769DRAFT_1513835 [Suillus cothurnatus]|nr:hypothetical protein BD769DRAFT_1513835 [Suillus cothurnatus]
MSSLTHAPLQLSQGDPRSIYGAFFIGSILAAVLFGLTTIQAFIYFQTHVGRWSAFYRVIVRLRVSSFQMLDAVHLSLTIHCVYYYLVTNFANVGAITEISFLVHRLYAHRIWIGMNRSRIFRIIPCIVIVLTSGKLSLSTEMLS